MAEITYNIEKKLGVLSTSTSGWTKEVNLVSWNGAAAKIDIRDWSPEDETGKRKMSKGITLTSDEAKALAVVLGEFNG